MRNNRKTFIKKLTASLVCHYKEIPVPLEKIASDEELQVFYDSYGKNTFDGMTIYDDALFYIHLNTEKGNTIGSDRGRFTLAHELGHYFIDSHRIGLMRGLLEPHPSKNNFQQHAEIENEADYFASCLLMPEKEFQDEIYKNKLRFRKGFNIELINILKEKFKVSLTACVIRFAEIGNHPIRIIYAFKDEIKWNIASGDFPFKYLANAKKPSRMMVLGEYYEKGTEDSFRTSSFYVVDCFTDVSEDDLQTELYEYCITNNNHAISILWGK